MNSKPLPGRRWLWLALVVMVLAGLAFYSPRAWSAYHEWTLRRMSLPRLETAARRAPDDIAARYRLGLVYGRAGRNDDAIRELLAVLEKDPTRPDVLNDLGALYLLQRRYYESLVALQAALTARPNYATAYANLGRLHLATKMPFTAVRELERARQLDPSNLDTLWDLGEAYQQTLNYAAAEGAYRKVLLSRPRSVASRVGLAKTYYGLTRYDEAEKELALALSLEPENPTALLTLGRIRMDRAGTDAEVAAARDLLRRAAVADPGDPEVWCDLGRAALRQKKAPQAVEFLRRALTIAPEHGSATFELSRALRAAGRTEEAKRTAAAFREIALLGRERTRLEEVVHQSPENWDAVARLAELQIKLGDFPMAALLCRRLAEGAPGHPKLPSLLRDLARRSAARAPAPPGSPPAPPAAGTEGG